MKSKTAFLFCIVFAAIIRAEDKTVFVSPGSKLEVRVLTDTAPKADRSLTAAEASDVVRAMEILMRYAPEKYSEYATQLTAASTLTSPSWVTLQSLRKTKADELRSDADDLEKQAERKRQKAAELDKDQEEIEWARGILAKWKAKLKSLQ